MRKITRLILISAVLATSGLTAKVATENYKAAVTNDERIHKAHELAKKPNKAAILEAIVAATNEESDKRIQKAVVLEPEEPKTPRVVRVTTSAGVSPIVPTMDKKTINKAEEFIEKVAHPGKVVMEKNLDFTTENIPVQELKYEAKDIFPEFEEVAEKSLTYKIKLPEITSEGRLYNADGLNIYYFDINGTGESTGTIVNNVMGFADGFEVSAHGIKNKLSFSDGKSVQCWEVHANSTNIIKFYPDTRTLDYSSLAPFKDSNEPIPGMNPDTPLTCKGVYDFLVGVETGKYPLLMGIS